MAWERRARGGLYYTRSRKVAGKVIREYVGGGLAGELAAAEDAKQRAEHSDRARAWTATMAALGEFGADVERFQSSVETLVTAAFLVYGYRRHGGEWRKQHGKSRAYTKAN